MSRITKRTLAIAEVEYAAWRSFMNLRVGVTAIGLGMSSLGTPSPFITSSLAVVFMTLFLRYGLENFPKKIRELRAGNLVGMDKIKLRGVEAENFSCTALFNNFPLYFVGMGFLFAVWLLSGMSII